MNSVRCFVLFCSLCFLVCFPGCGKPKNPDGRLDVMGKITLNSGPFEGANVCSISMSPIDDQSLGSSSTTFNSKTGKYLFTMQDGLKPGKYRVSISASAKYDKKTKKPMTSDTGEFDEYNVKLIPPEFNTKSQIEFEVVKGKKNVFDYDIVTDFVPSP